MPREVAVKVVDVNGITSATIADRSIILCDMGIM